MLKEIGKRRNERKQPVSDRRPSPPLVNWVTTGMKPAGDDILTPAAVAAPTFGCKFSVPGHLGFPACPP